MRRKCDARRIAVCVLLVGMVMGTLAGVSDTRAQPGPAAGSEKSNPNAPIGTALMLPDGTIEISLRAEGPGGIVGHGRITYAPSHKDYQMILEHLGGLRPGETKLVPPWPR